jgi:hypothetical protein
MNGTRGFSIWVALMVLVAALRVSAAPPNDLFVSAIPLEGASGMTIGTNMEATREAGEPRIDDYDGGRSVWWRWTAPAAGVMTLSTFWSGFDTILGVYTGAAVSSLELVAENDDPDEGDGLHSVLAFRAVAGTAYHIVVDGVDEFGAENPSIVLSWFVSSGDLSVNDDFANRIRLDGSEGKAHASSVGATREAGEPNHGDGDGTRSLWWSWVAPGNGTGVLNTSRSTFDTLLAVYTGASLASLALVAENDDYDATAITSALRFRAVGGTEYQIAVDGFEDESGIVVLAWSFRGDDENPRFVRGDCNNDGAVNITDAVCTLEWLFQGGAEPECAVTTNADGLGAVDLTDPVYLLTYLFRGGPAPAAPFPECGLASAEEIGCWMPPSHCR